MLLDYRDDQHSPQSCVHANGIVAVERVECLVNVTRWQRNRFCLRSLSCFLSCDHQVNSFSFSSFNSFILYWFVFFCSNTLSRCCCAVAGSDHQTHTVPIAVDVQWYVSWLDLLHIFSLFGTWSPWLSASFCLLIWLYSDWFHATSLLQDVAPTTLMSFCLLTRLFNTMSICFCGSTCPCFFFRLFSSLLMVNTGCLLVSGLSSLLQVSLLGFSLNYQTDQRFLGSEVSTRLQWLESEFSKVWPPPPQKIQRWLKDIRPGISRRILFLFSCRSVCFHSFFANGNRFFWKDGRLARYTHVCFYLVDDKAERKCQWNDWKLWDVNFN